jgi:hypothetical protein
MNKIVSLNFHDLPFKLKDCEWYYVDETPPPPHLRAIFYNIFSDEWRISTFDELENDFRTFCQEFGELIAKDDPYIDYQISHSFHPTHWTPGPKKPTF